MAMEKRILVPVDFSSTSDKALAFAFDLARRTHAQLHVLHVVHLPMMDAAGPLGYAADAYKEMREKAEAELAEREEKYKDRGVNWVSEMADGFVAEEVGHRAEELQPTFLVLGTTGATGFIAQVMGTNAAHIVRKVKAPVILIPEQWEGGPIKDMVYAAMLEDSEIPFLSQAIAFAQTYDAHLSLLKVNASLQLNQTEDEPLINEIRAKFGEQTPALLHMKADSAAEGLEDFMEFHPVDALVLVSRRLNLFDRIFESSTTRRLTMQTRIPLLIMHRD
jgi:nucleotide-binding universal stress UspA family protein